MKVVVMGAGAVGCYFGGLLARTGHEVVMIGRQPHVAAIQRNGLRIQTAAFDEQVPVQASTDTSAAQGAQLVLFCVKSTDTESAGSLLAPHLAPEATVLCLQNGVDNADRLRTVLPNAQKVSAAVVYVATEMAGPGHVRHHGRGELVIEPIAGSAEAAHALTDAGVQVQISDNVRGALWSKLILNCAYNALSAITHLPYGEVMKGEGVHKVLQDVVNECLAVGEADGARLSRADIEAAVERIPGSMPAQYSSTSQDLSRGKPTEIDFLNGYVVRRGQALGIATPANGVLHTLVKLLERKQADMQ